MDIERLEEDIRNIEYELEYGEEQNQGRIAVDVNCLRSVIDFTNEAIARQSVKSEEAAEAISHIQGGYGDVWQWPKKRRDTIITALEKIGTNTVDVAWTEAYQSYESAGDEAVPYCPKCDADLEDDQKFCKDCGVELIWSWDKENT